MRRCCSNASRPDHTELEDATLLFLVMIPAGYWAVRAVLEGIFSSTDYICCERFGQQERRSKKKQHEKQRDQYRAHSNPPAEGKLPSYPTD